ncbi:3-oxoacyl-ACP reductase [Carnobacterium divergens]|uniref:elongation factor P 5-aminopentanone reductase n=1 Tax=Carnobacterium divergens TaxID=2748 RepID=UPI001072530A|nr:SDR family oxidoreductase [Carnobacterium divergens]TFJ43312.1 3-oxoacyl-ACP reductase [Carnobacterium divergens]TFJ50465.1 3-oxoacyl-ACP reductase [Carnobacterium divergens]
MKFALVMGASGDIGKAIAADLASDGWSLYLHGFKDHLSLDEQLERYQNQFPKQDFFKLTLDMTDEKGAATFLEALFQVDAVIFSSGFTSYQLLTEVSAVEMEKMWQVHLKTPLLLLQKLQPKLAKSTLGRIVFISSVYGEVGSAMEVLYSTLKGAQLAFVKAYSKEVASLGITVNAIAPGAIQTKMNSEFSETEVTELVQEIPVGRLGQPNEISFWAKQLLKKESSYMTGQTLTISGGWLK